jgi:3-oxoacyl-[acyl-carrier protein] reductase
MSQPLEGKVAIITGGSKGIGRATALRLAKDGAKLVINYSSDASAAEQVIKLIGADMCVAVKADAGNVAELEMLVAKTIKIFGRIDILVANAGIMPMMDLESSTEADFDRTMRLNVKGPYFLAQVSYPNKTTEDEIKILI